MELPQVPWKKYLTGTEPFESTRDGYPELCRRFIEHSELSQAFLAGIPSSKTEYRYAPEKWSIKQVVGHLTDANLIFLYRLICISRGESKSLPGFDENAYVEKADFGAAEWSHILASYKGIAIATTGMIQGLSAEAWCRRGSANDIAITPVEMLRVIMGHERHHIKVLKERYDLA